MTVKKVYRTSISIRLFVSVVLFFFMRIFKISAKLPNEVKNLKPPFLILGNHAGFWDPFVVGFFLPHFTHFVSSDAAFRNKFQRFFLTRLGTIPKKKNIRDTKVIRDISAVLRQGENVGLFPTGVRTWAGSSLGFDKSLVKLIRHLQVPVVVAVLKGMNLFNPRWSTKLRRTKVLVEYQLLFEPKYYNQLSDIEMFEVLKKAMYHNEVEHQRKAMNKISSKHKAEFVNHALYVCPECKSIDSFRAKGNTFGCKSCGYDIQINEFGFYNRLTNGKLYFDNMEDWYQWEEQWFIDYIQSRIDSKSDDCLFMDLGSSIYHSKKGADLELIGQADVKLFIDRIEFVFTNQNVLSMNFNDLQTINPQVNEMLEIFYKDEAYRVIGGRQGVSALKWEVAVNVIWKNMGQLNKLSPYINLSV